MESDHIMPACVDAGDDGYRCHIPLPWAPFAWSDTVAFDVHFCDLGDDEALPEVEEIVMGLRFTSSVERAASLRRYARDLWLEDHLTAAEVDRVERVAEMVYRVRGWPFDGL